MTAEVVQSTGEQSVVPEEKKFDVLNVLAEKVSGTVKWYSATRHYGFIQRDDNKEDVFVHRTAIAASRARFPTLRTGEPVEFNVVETTSGVNAASVTGPNGQQVQGIRFRRFKPSSDSGDGSAKQGGDTNAGGDGEGARPRGGHRRPRRGRRSFGSSRNGMGDGENAGETGGENAGEGEEQLEGTADGSRVPRQRPRRFRGGPRGGGRGRPRSTSAKQVNGEEQTEGAAGEEGNGAQGRPQGGFRRGTGGRFRRGGGGRGRRGGFGGASRNGEANGEQNNENAVNNERVEGDLDTKMEKMNLDTPEKANGVVLKEEASVKVPEASD